MRRRTLSTLCLSIVALLVLPALHAGCAARKEVVAKEKPEVGVRLPAIGKSDISVQMQAESPVMQHGLPLSEAEESRGRWLTLFEIDVSPGGETHPASGPPPEEP